MRTSLLLLMTALLATTALAGCSSSGNAGGGAFTMTPPAVAGGAYAFEAKVTADNYTWDLGDHLTTKYGASITHAYDVKDGKLTVVLHARTGKDTKDYSQSLILGTGTNAPSTFIMESSANWTVTGETVVFSAGASHDPEGDALRFSWSCNRFGNAERKPIHSHASFGLAFASAPAGSVTSGLATHPLPKPDVTYSGDLCDALSTGTPLSTHATTITGAFSKTGVYDIYLIAADPVHPTTSGSFRIYVTTAAERPALVQFNNFTDLFQGGVNGGLQGACGNDPTGPRLCDVYTRTFNLPLNGLGGTAVFDYTATGAPAQAKFEIKHGDAVVTGGDKGTYTFNGANLGITNNPAFTLTVTLTAGVQVTFHVNTAVSIDRDPAKVY